MFDRSKVREVLDLTKREQWPYPIIFNMLKEAGVEHYDVDVEHYKIVYTGQGGEWIEQGDKTAKTIPVERFDAVAVKRAIGRTQRHETNYTQFLEDIAAAGVRTYRVTMATRTIEYRGPGGQSHVESVPQP